MGFDLKKLAKQAKEVLENPEQALADAQPYLELAKQTAKTALEELKTEFGGAADKPAEEAAPEPVAKAPKAKRTPRTQTPKKK
jgi:hypothetical protein